MKHGPTRCGQTLPQAVRHYLHSARQEVIRLPGSHENDNNDFQRNCERDGYSLFIFDWFTSGAGRARGREGVLESLSGGSVLVSHTVNLDVLRVQQHGGRGEAVRDVLTSRICRGLGPHRIARGLAGLTQGTHTVALLRPQLATRCEVRCGAREEKRDHRIMA